MCWGVYLCQLFKKHVLHLYITVYMNMLEKSQWCNYSRMRSLLHGYPIASDDDAFSHTGRTPPRDNDIGRVCRPLRTNEMAVGELYNKLT